MNRKPAAEVRPLVLVVTGGGDTTREHELKQASIIIGSGPTANVILDGDDVSTIHAVIKVTLDTATLIDLGSETGTKINGNDVTERELKSGDVIAIGRHSLRVDLPEQAAAPVDDGTAPTALGTGGASDDENQDDENKTVVVAAGMTNVSTPAPVVIEGTQPQTPKAKRAAKKPAAKRAMGQSRAAIAEAETLPHQLPVAEPSKTVPAPPPKAPPAKAMRAPLPMPTYSEPTAADDDALPELNGRLSGVPVDADGIPNALFDADIAPAERSSAGDVRLQVALFWGHQLLQVRHFEQGHDVSIGKGGDNTLSIATDLLPETMVFAHTRAGGSILCVPSELPAALKAGKQVYRRDVLQSRKRMQDADGVVPMSILELGLDERFALQLGALTLAAQHVRPAAQIRSTWAETLDQAFAGTLLFVALFALFIFFMVVVSPRGEDAAADDLFKAQQRFAKLLLKNEPPPKKFQLSGKEGGKHQNDDGKLGKREIKPRDAQASKAGAPRVDPNKREKDRKIALSSGILGALKGGKTDATSNVFGPGGLGTGINNALGGLRGTSTGDAGGAGAIGTRGTGPGQGGQSLGIGGVGKADTRGTEGLGNVDLGGRGRAERSVEHGKTTVVGALSMEAIKRVLDRAQSQLRFCYEKELQRLPDLYGKVTVKFTIGGTGNVTDASTAASTMNNANVEDCLLRVFHRLKFPQPQGGGVVDVSYPMIYKPSGD